MYLGLNLDTGELLAVKAVPIALDEDDEVGVGVVMRCLAAWLMVVHAANDISCS